MRATIKNFVNPLIFLHGLAASLIIFTFMGLMPRITQAAGIPPLVFLNDTPRPITVTRGQPVRVPMFVVGGDCTNQQVELFIWRTNDNGGVMCLGPDGWTERNDWDECSAIGPIPALPSYIHFSWTAFENSIYLSDFDLHFCVDDQVNGMPETLDSGHIFCGNQKIIIKDEAASQEPNSNSNQEETQRTNDNEDTSQQEQQQTQTRTEHTSITPGSNLHAPSWGFNFSAPAEEDFNNYSSSRQTDCSASSASVSPGSLSLKVYIGRESTSATLYVRDNCRNYVDANATTTSDSLTLTNVGTGRIKVTCDTSGLDIGTHNMGTVVIVDSFGTRHNIQVKVTVSEIQTASSSGIETLSPDNSPIFRDVAARQARYFKFSFDGGKGTYEIQLGNTPHADQPRTAHMIIKKGSTPTLSDYDMTIGSHKSCSGIAGLYCKSNFGSQGEFIEIPPEDLTEPTTFYVMLYNDGDRNVKSQRISLTIQQQDENGGWIQVK